MEVSKVFRASDSVTIFLAAQAEVSELRCWEWPACLDITIRNCLTNAGVPHRRQGFSTTDAGNMHVTYVIPDNEKFIRNTINVIKEVGVVGQFCDPTTIGNNQPDLETKVVGLTIWDSPQGGSGFRLLLERKKEHLLTAER